MFLRFRYLVFLFVFLALAGPTLSWSQVPSEVTEAFRSYRAALKVGDFDLAREHAERAYDIGSKSLDKDSKTLGALAHNFAELTPDREQRVELYQVALNTGSLESEDDILLRAQRFVALGQAHIEVGRRFDRKAYRRAWNDIDEGWDFIEENNLQDMTFGAEMMVLKGWAASTRGAGRDGEEAIEWYDRADKVFAGPDHDYFSLLQYVNKLLRGKTLNSYDRPIEAALAFQEVMQNQEGKLPADHPYVNEAFSGWLSSRGMVEQAGRLAEAEEKGLCKCWPYDEKAEKAPIPILRVPPKMPRNAKRSGHVMLQFDIDESGQPMNVEAIGYTEKLFVSPALISTKKWRYDMSNSYSAEDLSGITTKVTFRLSDGRGNIIPERDIQMLVSPQG